jgi:hypothetical protein
MVTGAATPESFARVLDGHAAALTAAIAGRLYGRAGSIFRAREPARSEAVLAALLAALRLDLVTGGARQLRGALGPALGSLGDTPISFRDLRLLAEELRIGLHGCCTAEALPPEAHAAVEDWCFELAYLIGLRLVHQRDDLIARQATEIELKLAEQRQLNRLVGELREEARQLGQYTLQAKIGEGGMGVVYRGRHALLRRPTAIKLLSPERSRKEDLLRFEREVRLTARLTHPNTVTIFDFGRTPDDVFYYAMELLEGGTLEDIVAVAGPQPPARVAQVLQMIAGALSEAHGIGLIHRDIKPANIMLCEKGGEHDVAKVLDFGLVKETRLGAAPSLTQDSQITGTPYYMAPEAILDPQHVDGRADLYALGAVGYYLLTGHNVFEGRSSIEVMSQHLHKEPPPPSQRLGTPVPPDLEAVLLACLRKTPNERPADALALRQRLRACRDLGTWELEDARAWWEKHGEAVRERRAVHEDIAGAQTIDIALQVLRS